MHTQHDTAPPAAFAAIPGPLLAPAAVPTPGNLRNAREFTLPNGLKLRATISRKAIFEQSAGVTIPDSVSDCLQFLYLCSPDFDSVAWWNSLAQPSTGEEDAPGPNAALSAQRIRAMEWQDAHFGPDDEIEIMKAAFYLWSGKEATFEPAAGVVASTSTN